MGGVKRHGWFPSMLRDIDVTDYSIFVVFSVIIII